MKIILQLMNTDKCGFDAYPRSIQFLLGEERESEREIEVFPALFVFYFVFVFTRWSTITGCKGMHTDVIE